MPAQGILLARTQTTPALPLRYAPGTIVAGGVREKPGVGLEGDPYAKNNQQKAVRILLHPDRFLLFVLVLTFFLITLDTAVYRWAF